MISVERVEKYRITIIELIYRKNKRKYIINIFIGNPTLLYIQLYKNIKVYFNLLNRISVVYNAVSNIIIRVLALELKLTSVIRRKKTSIEYFIITIIAYFLKMLYNTVIGKWSERPN